STGFSATSPPAESVQPPSALTSSCHWPASPGPAGPWVWKPEGASSTHTEGTWSCWASAGALPAAGAAAFEAASVENASSPGGARGPGEVRRGSGVPLTVVEEFYPR